MVLLLDSSTWFRETSDEPLIMVPCGSKILRNILIITIGFFKHVSGHVTVPLLSLAVLFNVVSPPTVVTTFAETSLEVIADLVVV